MIIAVCSHLSRSVIRIARAALYTLTLLFFAHHNCLNAQSYGLHLLGTYKTGRFDVIAAEIAAYDPVSKNLYVVDADSSKVFVLSIANPSSPQIVNRINVKNFGSAHSVAVKNGIVAVAVESSITQASGKAVFFTTGGIFQKAVNTGPKPDNIVFSPDGRYVLTADEAPPNDSYSNDPEGSVSIIDISGGIANLTQANVTTLTFASITAAQLDSSVRIFGPNATIAKDLEPEYITVSADSKTAWVTLQENNAVGIIDLSTQSVIAVKGLGFKNHSLSGNGLDASDEDGENRIRNWKIFGMYQPDAIVSFQVNNKTYLAMANEGDSRTYGSFNEEFTISKSSLDQNVFPLSDSLWLPKNLGRLKFTKTLGKPAGSTTYRQLYAFGARSFSIRDSACNLIWDSGDQMEQTTAQANPNFFNCDNTNNTRDDRSDECGPEPEGVATGMVDDSLYAFVCLERVSGIMVYNITNPLSPKFTGYTTTRNFSFAPSQNNVNKIGDVGEEGILFIPAVDSPIGVPLVVTASEVSGTVSVFRFDNQPNAVDDAGATFSPAFELRQNYPNPFNPGTRISFTVKHAGFISLCMFSAFGEKIATLAEEYFETGTHTREFSASGFPSGVYFYRLTDDSGSSIAKKAILLR